MLLLALVAAAFLNAEGLRKTAHIQSPGAARRCVWLTGKLARRATPVRRSAGHALQVAIGRSADDAIDTRVVLAPPPTPKPPVPAHGDRDGDMTVTTPHHARPPFA